MISDLPSIPKLWAAFCAVALGYPMPSTINLSVQAQRMSATYLCSALHKAEYKKHLPELLVED